MECGFSLGREGGVLAIEVGENGRPVRVSVVLAPTDQRVEDLTQAFCGVISVALQNGVPSEKIAKGLAGISFSPWGYAGDRFSTPESLPEYILRQLLKLAKTGEEEDVQHPSGYGHGV